MDFEGMQEALQPYDGLIIEADSEAEAEKIILKKRATLTSILLCIVFSYLYVNQMFN